VYKIQLPSLIYIMNKELNVWLQQILFLCMPVYFEICMLWYGGWTVCDWSEVVFAKQRMYQWAKTPYAVFVRPLSARQHQRSLYLFIVKQNT